MKYKRTKLSNGVRVITVPNKGNPSVTVMVATETGSNHESKEENGLSHFLEHMLFKGTPTRPSALHVSLELDSIGAESNAFTSNEITAYHAKSDKRHWKKLLEVVSDMYLNASLPAAELEKERGVILQEISMYEDLPERKVWDTLGTLLYGDTPAGRTTLGPSENIKNFSQTKFREYKDKHYVAGKTVVIVSGDVKPSEVESMVKKIFKDIPKGKVIKQEKVEDNQKEPALKLETKTSDQTHMIMAFRAHSARDKRNTAVSLLMNILGGGMSSRLFQKLRNDLGACYYVRTYNDSYTDHGFVAIATGIDKNRASEIVEVLIEETKKLKTELVSKEELQKNKDYMISHAVMALETSDNVAGFVAEGEVVRGKIMTIEEIEKKILSITPKEVQKIANEIFKDENMNLAIVGNISDAEPIKKVLHF